MRTDGHDEVVVFRNFANALKNRWRRRMVENTGKMAEQLMFSVSSQLTTDLVFHMSADN